MSDGDRGRASRYGVVIWTAVSLIFIGGILGWAIPRHLSYGNEAAYNTEYHDRNAHDQIWGSCVNLPRAALDGCVEKAHATSEKRQREERDLEAQRKMSLWTAIMGAMAVIGVGLSGLGIYLILRTWQATRIAADAAENTFIMSSRPWIICEELKNVTIEADISPVDNERKYEISFDATFTNVGHSPSSHIILNYGGHPSKAPKPGTFDERDGGTLKATAILNTIIPSEKRPARYTILEVKEADLLAGNDHFFIYLVMAYKFPKDFKRTTHQKWIVVGSEREDGYNLPLPPLPQIGQAAIAPLAKPTHTWFTDG